LNYSDSKKTKNEESVPIEIKFEVCPTLKKKTKKNFSDRMSVKNA